MPETIITEAENRMNKGFEATGKEFSRVQTGRASTTLLDGITVEYYGNISPINQVATLTTPDAQSILIKPWDKSSLKEIEKSIARSELGLNPNNDGNVIRIQIPELTTERRKELTKHVNKLSEEGRIAIRNIRRNANDSLKKMEKAKEISEDERHGHSKTIQDLTDRYIGKIDELFRSKENELMTQ